MRQAYLDSSHGISGDMLLGALVDAGLSVDRLNEVISSLGIPGCRLSAKEVRRCGFRATKVDVHAAPGQELRHLSHILHTLQNSSLSNRLRDRAERAFRRLAEVEAQAHGIAVDEVHFHELGAVDTIVDVVGTLVGFDELGIERLVASPVPVGSGFVATAHGRLRIPAPATAELLRGVPLDESDVELELTTPTGALLLTQLASSFGPLPTMKIDRIGCGAGDRDTAHQPNIVRLFVGHETETMPDGATDLFSDEVYLLETNLDDAGGELIGHCVERLQKAGALDVWTTPIQMKKSRPGVLLSVLCRPDALSIIETIIFCETTTLGLRRRLIQRHMLHREPCEVVTTWGAVEGKIRRLPDGRADFAPEYESCRQVAEQHGVSLGEVYRSAWESFGRKQNE